MILLGALVVLDNKTLLQPVPGVIELAVHVYGASVPLLSYEGFEVCTDP